MPYLLGIAGNSELLRDRRGAVRPPRVARRRPFEYHRLVEKYALIDKPEGLTPLQALESYRRTRGIAASIPMTYAGRLDPMASGQLIVLIGEECKQKDAYTGLDKVYEFEILFGAATDTGDILGLVTEYSAIQPGIPYEEIVLEGTRTLPYPAFSSKTVGGVPLFRLALEDRLRDIRVPTRDMTVQEAAFIGARTMTGIVLRAEVARRVGQLVYDEHGPAHNDFREEKVLASWADFPDGVYTLARYRVRVTGGTYIRSIVEDASRRMKLPALAYMIRRTRIIGLP